MSSETARQLITELRSQADSVVPSQVNTNGEDEFHDALRAAIARVNDHCAHYTLLTHRIADNSERIVAGTEAGDDTLAHSLEELS